MEFCILQTKEIRSQLFSPTQLLVDNGARDVSVRTVAGQRGQILSSTEHNHDCADSLTIGR
jgi:hypothetical protein